MPLTVSRSAVLGLAASPSCSCPPGPDASAWLAYRSSRADGTVLGGDPHPDPLLYQLFSQTGRIQQPSRLDAYSAAAPFIDRTPGWAGIPDVSPQTYFFVDDQYLTSLIETGTLGLLALIIIFVLGWRMARLTRRSCADEKNRDLLQCLAVSVATPAVSFFTLSTRSGTRPYPA